MIQKLKSVILIDTKLTSFTKHDQNVNIIFYNWYILQSFIVIDVNIWYFCYKTSLLLTITKIIFTCEKFKIIVWEGFLLRAFEPRAVGFSPSTKGYFDLHILLVVEHGAHRFNYEST